MKLDGVKKAKFREGGRFSISDESMTASIYEKGYKVSCKGHRGIRLVSTASKLLVVNFQDPEKSKQVGIKSLSNPAGVALTSCLL